MRKACLRIAALLVSGALLPAVATNCSQMQLSQSLMQQFTHTPQQTTPTQVQAVSGQHLHLMPGR